MNFILSVLTLGMLPLFRWLSPPPTDPRRYYWVRLNFEQFGNPPAERLKKALKKFFKGDELDEAYDLLVENSYLYVRTEREGEDLVEAVEKVGFQVIDEDIYEAKDVDGDRWWDQESRMYKYLQDLNYCQNCQRKKVRIYRDFDGDHCSSCDGTDVLNPRAMSLKEFQKHVTWIESAPTSAQRKNASSLSDLVSDTISVSRYR